MANGNDTEVMSGVEFGGPRFPCSLFVDSRYATLPDIDVVSTNPQTHWDCCPELLLRFHSVRMLGEVTDSVMNSDSSSPALARVWGSPKCQSCGWSFRRPALALKFIPSPP